jgi:hypothetical protein
MVLFLRRSGLAYVCDDKDVASVEEKLQAALFGRFNEFERIVGPIGGAFRVRAVEAQLLDVTTLFDRSIL